MNAKEVIEDYFKYFPCTCMGTKSPDKHFAVCPTVIRKDLLERLNATATTTPPGFTERLGLDTNWPLRDVLNTLADAVEHLGKAHDCDCNGWEIPQGVVPIARDYAKRLAEQVSAGVNPSYTERARQLAEEVAPYELFHLGSAATAAARTRLVNAITNKVASALTEAATQGQIVGIERAAEVCGKRVHAYLNELHETLNTPAACPEGQDDFTREIRTLSPDPGYLNRVRNEAATAALEQERKRIKELFRYKTKYEFGEYGDTQFVRFSDLLAAIGDDKDERGNRD